MASTSAANIPALCEMAFDHEHKNVEFTTAALKKLANTLLLEEKSRQQFADSGYATKVADNLQVDGEDREIEMICSRVLFLLTYNTSFDFNPLFDDHYLAKSIENNIMYHGQKYSGRNLREDEVDTNTPICWLRLVDTRALSESLKLLFNLCQFYPDRKSSFTPILPQILMILYRTHLEPNPLQPPVNYLINALLNFDLPGCLEKTVDDDPVESTPLFPSSHPTGHTQRLISILDLAVRNEKEEVLETTAIPLLTLLRRVNEIAPPYVQEYMSKELLPSDSERDQPLGRSDSLASRLLKLSTTPVAPNLKEGVSSLLFELSSKDAATFVRNVGYGYAAGYLMTHNIPVPASLNASEGDAGEKVTTIGGREINPITGQRRDMEPPDPGLEMTDEEKEREAEKLFVLFERLKATGVMSATNPVEQASREGRLEEVDD